MFSSLLLEERLRIVRRRRWLRRTGAQKAALQEAPRHALHHALLIHRSSPDDSLREARRKRISGQVMAGKSLRNREGTASPNSSASSEEEVGFDKTVLRLGGDTRGIKWTPDSRENEAIEKVERHLQFMNGFDFGWRG